MYLPSQTAAVLHISRTDTKHTIFLNFAIEQHHSSTYSLPIIGLKPGDQLSLDMN